VNLRRGLLWGFLVVALLAVAAAALLQRMRQPEPLPVYGQLPAFSLVNRDGRTVRLEDLAGKAWVADFVFTRCPASCPMMSARMARLDRDLPPDLDARLVSISVDPVHDTPEVLERYARKLQAPERWLFLTGGRQEIRRLCVEGFKLGLDMEPPPGTEGPEPILHSTRFVLVDGEGRIRGYYEAFDEASTEKLRQDLLRLVSD
jgi:cytochrome oxidase Cu insertion factor (SCO1/SenC/PrrC family)